MTNTVRGLKCDKCGMRFTGSPDSTTVMWDPEDEQVQRPQAVFLHKTCVTEELDHAYIYCGGGAWFSTQDQVASRLLELDCQFIRSSGPDTPSPPSCHHALSPNEVLPFRGRLNTTPTRTVRSPRESLSTASLRSYTSLPSRVFARPMRSASS
jgi:hypothetical protein